MEYSILILKNELSGLINQKQRLSLSLRQGEDRTHVFSVLERVNKSITDVEKTIDHLSLKVIKEKIRVLKRRKKKVLSSDLFNRKLIIEISNEIIELEKQLLIY